MTALDEYGIAKCYGPFETEREAFDDALGNGLRGGFITGKTDAGWYWAREEDYTHLGGTFTIGVGTP
jgi:hypothetical protein